MNWSEKLGQGTFFYHGEQYTITRLSYPAEWHGYHEVTDKEGFSIATALTKEIALRAAVDELDYWSTLLDEELEVIFGEAEK